MHDFIQNLSFNRQSPFPATRSASEPLRSVMRSFDDEPSCSRGRRPQSGLNEPGCKSAFRSSPRRAAPKSHHSQRSLLN